MSQSKHAEARELMCSGALLFFSHGQVSGRPRLLRGGGGGGQGAVGGWRLSSAAGCVFSHSFLSPSGFLLHVLQQNSAADLSMLVLESLEKAEVEVADELLGEASRGSRSPHRSVSGSLHTPPHTEAAVPCQGLLQALPQLCSHQRAGSSGPGWGRGGVCSKLPGKWWCLLTGGAAGSRVRAPPLNRPRSLFRKPG